MDEECGGLENRRVSLTDVLPFCDQLEKFIKYIGSVRDLNFITYEYPKILQNRLDTDVIELETILGEVKEALANAKRLRNQRKSIKREKISVKKILKRMRDDEVREMECAISVYDKPMFSRWESLKTTQRPEVLEVMLTDIKGKQLALDNLAVLVTRKLNQIQVFQPLKNGEVNQKYSSGIIREKSVIPLPFPSFCTPIIPIPIPPPLPPLPLLQAPVSHLPKRSYPQRLSVQRRRRLERRGENLEGRSLQNVEDLSSVSLTLSDLPNNLTGNLYPTILRPICNSNQDVVSDNNGASMTVRNCLNDVTLLDINENNNDSNNNEDHGLGSEFQSEMRTVLQALFGDLRSAPTLLGTESTSSNLAETENTSNTNKEIELYALRKAQ